MTPHQLSSGDLTADRRAQYARLYAEGGDLVAAVDLQHQALKLVPDWAAGWHGLGDYCEKAGDLAGAAEAWRKVLTLSPVDIFGAGLKLSLTGQAAPPAIPPSEYVEALFDEYSGRFDTALVNRLGYCVPERLACLIGEVAGEAALFAKTIDLGCGTGLFGERIRHMTSWLEGYDLSQGMLAKAVEKGVYDHLDQADILHGCLASQPADAAQADLVAAADVFAYFGDLDGVLVVASTLVKPGGLLAFSCEAGPDAADWLLQGSLRYCHSAVYLRRLVERQGLVLERMVRETIRRDCGMPIEGLLVIARRPDGARIADADLTAASDQAFADAMAETGEPHALPLM
ncbi:methyltransferase domain-containing protein [Hoeflea sp. YIM 152468]|uniref:methyltransferase domain-containing protein n=1 Tax=Hoeflea sp. YIM 152468 TaxID=3031759 RepID=UPI0023DB4EF4|nr:methyltransferase domain-containing protein [Hoeflea sp. YIM 152468]MDF1608789.1 methyltransferase domain-containing protein [Hoeflea sp. YIM 152468]